jgi:hypothetical protein
MSPVTTKAVLDHVRLALAPKAPLLLYWIAYSIRLPLRLLPRGIVTGWPRHLFGGSGHRAPSHGEEP